MRRRTYLGSIPLVGATFAGCASYPTSDSNTNSSSDDPPGENDTNAAIEYEECQLDIVGVENLPEPARNEVESALEDGTYESDEDVALLETLDLEESSLRYESDMCEYYDIVVETGDQTTTLELEEAHPETTEELDIVNETNEEQVITIELSRADHVEFEEEYVVEGDETLPITEDIDFRLGEYLVSIETDDFADELEWEIDQFGRKYFLAIGETDAVLEGPEDSVDPQECRWDDDGNLESQ